MTCIVAVRTNNKVVLAADRLGAGNGVKQLFKTTKLAKQPCHRVDSEYKKTKIEIGIGYTTSFRMGDILKSIFVPPDIDNGEDEEEYLITKYVPSLQKCFEEHGFIKSSNGTKTGGNFLLTINGRIFHIQDDFSVLEPELPFLAVGSGQEFALGALYASAVTLTPVEKALLAIQAAGTFSTTVSKEAEFIEFSIDKCDGLMLDLGMAD